MFILARTEQRKCISSVDTESAGIFLRLIHSVRTDETKGSPRVFLGSLGHDRHAGVNTFSRFIEPGHQIIPLAAVPMCLQVELDSIEVMLIYLYPHPISLVAFRGLERIEVPFVNFVFCCHCFWCLIEQ